MEYLCDLKGDELSKLDEDELRTKLYKVKEEDLSQETLSKIEQHFAKEGLKLRFSTFLQEYKQELYRKERAEVSRKENAILEKERKEKEAERKKKEEIQREIERKSSLKYWLENHSERFERGTISIGSLCLQTYPCQHGVMLEYVDEEGKVGKQSFRVFGDKMLELFNKYPNLKGVTEVDKTHFKQYEDMDKYRRRFLTSSSSSIHTQKNTSSNLFLEV